MEIYLSEVYLCYIRMLKIMKKVFQQSIACSVSGAQLSLQSSPLTAYFACIQQQRSGYPDLPPPPPSLLVNSHEDLDDPSYTTVKEIRVSPINTSPRVKLLRAPDGEIVRSGSRKYQNVLKVDTLSSTVSLPGEGQRINSPNNFHIVRCSWI